MNFEELKTRWKWSPIRNCPGRFIWCEDDKNITPEELAGSKILFREFQVKNAVDTVVVGQLNDGGLISYKKKDETYLHTLNNTSGFKRKLAQLGIKL